MISKFGLECTAKMDHLLDLTMKINKLLLIFLIVFPLFITACSTTTEPSEMYRGQSPEYIFQQGEQALRKKRYEEAIKRFEALDVQYPYDPNAERAQYQIIYAYYMSGDYASAESAADRFIQCHPTSCHVDYALFMRGISNYFQNLGVFERVFAVDLATRDLCQIKKSFNDFSEIYHTYPNSCYAPAAHQYMVYLRNILACHELSVARYYYSRCAFIAAASRANLVVRHYEGSPSVPEALVLMTKSYRRLGLNQNANESLQVLQYNYPNSSCVREAMRS